MVQWGLLFFGEEISSGDADNTKVPHFVREDTCLKRGELRRKRLSSGRQGFSEASGLRGAALGEVFAAATASA